MGRSVRRPNPFRGLANRLRLHAGFLAGKLVSGGRPIEINLELTGHCNHTCVFCPQTTMSRAKGHMDVALFEKLVREAAGWVELVLLHLGGEPTLHPHLGELLKIARAHRVPTLLSTNAAILDDARREALLADPPDILIFSLDATDEATYHAIGRSGSFERTSERVRAYLAEKRTRGATLPLTMVQLILMKANAHQAKDFDRAWRALGADLVRLKPYVDFPGIEEFHGTGRPRRGVGKCIYLWRQMAVLWDGRAVACCLDMEGVTDMGDTRRHTLAEIWNGPAFRAMRDVHVQGKAGEIAPCATCTMPRLAPWQLAGATALDAAALKSLLPRYEQLMRKVPALGYL